MIRIRPNTPVRVLRRQAVSLLAILGLLVSALMPWAQANAAAQGATTLLAAICSPNGVRYVEIDIGPVETEAPGIPGPAGLDHCPGCLGGGVMAMPSTDAVQVMPRPGDRMAPTGVGDLVASLTRPLFQPRAPPVTR